jgi:membrane protease YdiL (CAAX protease family)
LFRGVLQTHLGIWIASLVFAILHFRYLSKWLLFIMVVSISFLLGIVYEITDTLYTTILAHFLIDLVFAIQIRLQYLKGVNEDNE